MRIPYRSMKVPYCQTCKTTTGPLMKSTYIKKYDRRYHICRSCNAKRAREVYQKNPEARSRTVKKYEKNNPERRKAWNAAYAIPAQPCEVCGQIEKVHRHHPDPFDRMRVNFLCPAHHKEEHRRLDECEKRVIMTEATASEVSLDNPKA